MNAHDLQVQRLRDLYGKVRPTLERFCKSPAPSEDWFVEQCLYAETWIRDLKAQRSAGSLPAEFSDLIQRIDTLEQGRNGI